MLLKSWPLWNRWRKRLAEAGIELDENDPESGIQILRELARLQVRHPERAKKMQEVLMGGSGRLGGLRGARRFLHMLENTSAYVEMTSGTGFGRAELKRLKVPILAIFGEHTMALASGRALQRICENCTLEVVPNAGHFFPLTKPQAFLNPTHHFLAAQLPSAPPAPRIAPPVSA
jgi:pimeloyl-ACP methyl ester carboxylesterase